MLDPLEQLKTEAARYEIDESDLGPILTRGRRIRRLRRTFVALATVGGLAVASVAVASLPTDGDDVRPVRPPGEVSAEEKARVATFVHRALGRYANFLDYQDVVATGDGWKAIYLAHPQLSSSLEALDRLGEPISELHSRTERLERLRRGLEKELQESQGSLKRLSQRLGKDDAARTTAEERRALKRRLSQLEEQLQDSVSRLEEFAEGQRDRAGDLLAREKRTERVLVFVAERSGSLEIVKIEGPLSDADRNSIMRAQGAGAGLPLFALTSTSTRREGGQVLWEATIFYSGPIPATLDARCSARVDRTKPLSKGFEVQISSTVQLAGPRIEAERDDLHATGSLTIDPVDLAELPLEVTCEEI